MEKINEVKLSLLSMGGAQEWFLSIKSPDVEERSWLIGRKTEVENIIRALRAL